MGGLSLFRKLRTLTKESPGDSSLHAKASKSTKVKLRNSSSFESELSADGVNDKKNSYNRTNGKIFGREEAVKDVAKSVLFNLARCSTPRNRDVINRRYITSSATGYRSSAAVAGTNRLNKKRHKRKGKVPRNETEKVTVASPVSDGTSQPPGEDNDNGGLLGFVMKSNMCTSNHCLNVTMDEDDESLPDPNLLGLDIIFWKDINNDKPLYLLSGEDVDDVTNLSSSPTIAKEVKIERQRSGVISSRRRHNSRSSRKRNERRYTTSLENVPSLEETECSKQNSIDNSETTPANQTRSRKSSKGRARLRRSIPRTNSGISSITSYSEDVTDSEMEEDEDEDDENSSYWKQKQVEEYEDSCMGSFITNVWSLIQCDERPNETVLGCI